jgi:hypothetical protein
MIRNVVVVAWLDEFDQLIMDGPRGKQAVVPQSDAGSVMDELFSEKDGYALAEDQALKRSVSQEEFEFWLPTGGGHVRNNPYRFSESKENKRVYLRAARAAQAAAERPLKIAFPDLKASERIDIGDAVRKEVYRIISVKMSYL